jgi:mono/diheme cytochrome c family protein
MLRSGIFVLTCAFIFLFFIGDARSNDEAAGRRLYLEGVTPSGEPLSALVGFGRTPIGGQAVACGNCHGADGKGRAESSVLPPEITWEELTKPYGHSHSASGRKHGAFNERSLARAVNEGLDPAGNSLDWTMPRYALSRAEAQALVAYLRRLSAQREPGIGERSLRIGTVLPHAGALDGATGAMQAALAAYVETVNRAGGIHQRRLELVAVGDYREAQERFAAQPVFALLSPSESEREGELGAFVARTGLPTVGPLTATPEALRHGSAAVFQIFAGLTEQTAFSTSLSRS